MMLLIYFFGTGVILIAQQLMINESECFETQVDIICYTKLSYTVVYFSMENKTTDKI